MKQEYKVFSNKVTKLKATAKKNYYADELEKNKSNSRKTWKLLRAILPGKSPKSSNLPTSIRVNEKEITEKQSILEEFNQYIPYLFEYKSHFFVPRYHPKSQVRLIHEYMKCIVCHKNFLRCFLSIEFYSVSFHLIILLIAFHASSVPCEMRVSTPQPFFSVLTHLVIIYPLKLCCITCHLHRMLMRMFQR